MRIKLLVVSVAIAVTLVLAAPASAWHDYYNPASYTTPIAGTCYPITQWGHPQWQHWENWLAVDIGTPSGTPVYAPKGGQVVFEGWEGDGGIVIRIQHYDSPYNNGLQTILAHLNQSVVDDGQWVSKNQFLGYSGNTGATTGPHLHWALVEPQTGEPVPLDNIPGVDEPNWICP